MASLDEVVIIRNDEGFDPLLFRDVVKQTRDKAAAAPTTQAPTPAPATTDDAQRPRRRVIVLPRLQVPALLRADNDRVLRIAIWTLSVLLAATLGWGIRGDFESLIRRFTIPDQVAGPAGQSDPASAAGAGASLYDASLRGGTSRGGEEDGARSEGPADRGGSDRLWANRGLLGNADDSSGTGAPVEGPSRIDWGDDLDHVVVSASVVSAEPTTRTPTTDPAPQTPSTSSGAESQSPEATQPDETRPDETRPDETKEVQRRDGSVDVVSVPSQALALGLPTPAEQSLIASLTDRGVSPFVVIDRNGVIGEANHRYVNTSTRLVDTGVLDDGTTQPGMAPTPSMAAVTGDGTVSEAALIAQLEQTPGVRSVTRVGPGLFEVVTDGKGAAIDGLPGVQRVDSDLLMGYASTTLPAPSSTHATGARTEAAAASPMRVAPPASVVVAVIDAGFDTDNPELAQQWWSNIDEDCFNGNDDDGNGFVDDCRGWDFGRHDADIAPERRDPGRDHGNEVASIVAAARDGYGITGVAPDATVMPLKVSRANGTVAMSAVAAAIDYAVGNGADVINISLITQVGIARRDVVVLEAAVARAEAAGVMIVTGAGNDARNLGLTPAWPASFAAIYQNVVTVGAGVGADDTAPFSSTGDVVSLYAPGVNVATVVASGEVVLRTGTSYAAPAVTGVLVEALQRRPDASMTELRSALDSAAVEVDGRRYLLDTTERDLPVGSINLADPSASAPAARTDSADARYEGWRTGGW